VVATWSRTPDENSVELPFPADEEAGEREVQAEVAAYCDRLAPIKHPATLEILDSVSGQRGSIRFEVVGLGENQAGNEAQALMASLSQHVNLIIESTNRLVTLQGAQLERMHGYNQALMASHLDAYKDRSSAHEALVTSQAKLLDVIQVERERRADAELSARVAGTEEEKGVLAQIMEIVPAEVYEQLPALVSLFIDYLKTSKTAGPISAALSTAADAAKVLAP
jgi:hypothetical protein